MPTNVAPHLCVAVSPLVCTDKASEHAIILNLLKGPVGPSQRILELHYHDVVSDLSEIHAARQVDPQMSMPRGYLVLTWHDRCQMAAAQRSRRSGHVWTSEWQLLRWACEMVHCNPVLPSAIKRLSKGYHACLGRFCHCVPVLMAM